MPRPLRLLKKTILVLLLLAILVPLAGWLALRGSLPDYEGQVRDKALAQPVRVERDALGSVTVHAGNRRVFPGSQYQDRQRRQ